MTSLNLMYKLNRINTYYDFILPKDIDPQIDFWLKKEELKFLFFHFTVKFNFFLNSKIFSSSDSIGIILNKTHS